MISPVKVLSPEIDMFPVSRAVIRDELSLKLLERFVIREELLFKSDFKARLDSKFVIRETLDPKSLTFEDWIAEIADPSPMK